MDIRNGGFEDFESELIAWLDAADARSVARPLVSRGSVAGGYRFVEWGGARFSIEDHRARGVEARAREARRQPDAFTTESRRCRSTSGSANA